MEENASMPLESPSGQEGAAPNKGGRPQGSVAWKPEYNDLILDYFDMEAWKEVLVITTSEKGFTKEEPKILPNRYPTLERFAHTIGHDDDTLANWAKYDKEAIEKEQPSPCPGFFGAYTRARKMQRAILQEGAMAGVFNGGFAIFLAKNTMDMTDETGIRHSGEIGGGKPDPAHVAEALAEIFAKKEANVANADLGGAGSGDGEVPAEPADAAGDPEGDILPQGEPAPVL